MTQLTIPPEPYAKSTSLIASVIESLPGRVPSFEGRERRAYARYVVALPTVVQPLDEQMQPFGKPFNGATRDISAGGIRLIFSQPVTNRFLGIRVMLPDGSDFELLVEVLRCVPLGSYYDVAGEFVTQSD